MHRCSFSRLAAFAVMAVAMPVIGQAGAQTKPDDPLPSPVFSAGNLGATTPIIAHSVPAKYTEAARRAKFQGYCIVQLIVDADGMPRDVHVLKPVGMGLDENAVEAVKQDRFKPGTYHRKPVAVRLSMVVNFDTPR